MKPFYKYHNFSFGCFFFPFHKIVKFKSVEKPLKYDDDNFRLFNSQ